MVYLGWCGGYGNRLRKDIEERIIDGSIHSLDKQIQKDLLEWHDDPVKLPKSLLKVNGKPMVHHILKSLKHVDPDFIIYVMTGQEASMKPVLDQESINYVLKQENYGDRWDCFIKELKANQQLIVFHGDVIYSKDLFKRIIDHKDSVDIVTSIDSIDDRVTVNDEGLITSLTGKFWELFAGQGYYKMSPMLVKSITDFTAEEPVLCHEYMDDAVYPKAIANGLKLRLLMHDPSELINVNDLNTYLLVCELL